MAIDFRLLAGLAMVRLGWSPDQFWTATPLDFAMAVDVLNGRPGQMEPMGRAGLRALVRRFPDRGVDDRLAGTSYKEPW